MDYGYNASDLLSVEGLNAVMFSDPHSKLCFTSLLVSQFDKVIYIDLDTAFTAYFRAGLVRNAKNLDIYLPSEDNFVLLLKDVLDSMQHSSLVIFDSVNSFYNMYYRHMSSSSAGRVLGSLNHLLSILLMMLVKHGRSFGVPVVVTSMMRYRKEKGWIQSPASRRLLQAKSTTKLKVELSKNNLVVQVEAHPTIQASTELVYRDSIIGV